MKILLISPPTIHTKGSGKPTLGIPLGLLYLGSVLEKEGYDVEIYDTRIDYNIEKVRDYIYFGDKKETIKERIKKSKPDVVGISNQYTIYTPTAKKVAKLVKEVNKNIKVIVGGAHVSTDPLDVLKERYVDYVVLGEGELNTLRLIKYLEKKERLENIDGVGYKINGKPVIKSIKSFIKNLDELPFPAYYLIDIEKYFGGFGTRSEYYGRVVSMITSRGCPFNCVFCSIHLHMSKVWRPHSVEYVVKHIKLLVEKYGVELIHFEDDNFTLDRDRFEKIIDRIIEEKINVKWDTPNGVRADTLTKNLLIKAKKSGCQYLIIGVESGNQDVVINIIKKGLDLKKVVNVAKWCHEIGLDLEAFFVIGFPEETLEQMEDTFKFAKMLNEKFDVFPHFNIATPLVNTELYDICEKKGYLIREANPKNLLIAQRKRGGMIRTPEFSPEDIDRLFEKYNLFIKKTRIKKVLKHPYLLKGYFLKELSKTPFFRFIRK